jgi:hypothetical protein
LNFNLGNVSTTIFYPLYARIPSTGKPVSALVTNTNNASDQTPVFERPQGLATGSLYLYPEDVIPAGLPAVLSGSNGVLSINGTPYNGTPSTVSTFATASISSLTVSSINGGAGAGSTSTFSTLTTSTLTTNTITVSSIINNTQVGGSLKANVLLLPLINQSSFSISSDTMRTFNNTTLSTVTFINTTNNNSPKYADVGVGRLLVSGSNPVGNQSITAGVIDVGPFDGSIAINAGNTWIGTMTVSSITGNPGSNGGQGAYQTVFVDYSNSSTITMAQLVSSVIGR